MLKIIFTLLVGFNTHADPPTIHGMLLFGDTYASHLPMFHHPHDYQLIMQVQLSENMQQAYDEQRQRGVELFTIVPARMDLSQIYSGAKKEFMASLYAGHFERGGSRIVGQMPIKVTKIVFSKRLDVDESHAGVQQYFVFGQGEHKFATHVISGRPSFDWIAEIDTDVVSGSRIQNTSGPLAGPSAGDVLGANDQVRVKKVRYFETGDLSH